MTAAKTVSFVPVVSGTVGDRRPGAASSPEERAVYELVCRFLTGLAKAIRRWKLGGE